MSLATDEANETMKNISKAPPGTWSDPKVTAVCQSVGSTACMALITPTEIYVANLGDSRCIISKDGSPFEMSVDHKPNLRSEKKRIKAAGGFVKDNRVQGMLNLSRSFGDMLYKSNPDVKTHKQMVIPVPEICVQKRCKEVDFLFIACDGIWDNMSSLDVCNFISDKFKNSSKRKSKAGKMSHIIEALFRNNIATDIHISNGKGCDNMTGILVTIN